MDNFTVERIPDANPCFRVLAPDGSPATDINEFLSYLSACGSSAYTLRAYGTGLAHFFSWLSSSNKHINEVTRQIVGEYIAAFGQASPCRPLISRQSERHTRRQPRTINHR